jgi:hypothetical protein
MADWYPTIKTIKGRPYLYRQRTWREGGRVRSQSQYVGPIDVAMPAGRGEAQASVRRKKRSRVNQVATAAFGVEDDYGRRVDSLWNRYVNKEQKTAARKPEPEKGKPAEAGQGEKSSFSVVGNGESDQPTATGSQSSSDPSAS